VALAVPAVVLLPVWWLERSAARPSWTGIFAAAAASAVVGLPWYVAMYAQHGVPYLASFFLTDNLERFTTSRFNEPRPLWFYPAVIVGGLLPWTLFAIAPAARGLGNAVRGRLAVSTQERRLWVWTLAPTLLFMAAVGQQPRYVLPVLPALAVLLAGSIDRRVTEEHGSLVWPTLGTAVSFLALAGMTLRLRPVLISVEPWAPWVAMLALGAAAVALTVIAIAKRWRALPATMAISAAAALLAVQFGALAGRRPEPVELIARAVVDERGASEPVAPYRVFVRNLVFYSRLRQQDLFDEASAVRFLQLPERVLLIVRPSDLTSLEQRAGVTTRELARVTYLNTANLRLRSLLQPAEDLLETVVLVSNR
jgi:4-amino-4-deoxy-L-arabinose transferase-like glycosyltransferase